MSNIQKVWPKWFWEVKFLIQEKLFILILQVLYLIPSHNDTNLLINQHRDYLSLNLVPLLAFKDPVT